MDIFRREIKELNNNQKAYVDLIKYKAQHNHLYLILLFFQIINFNFSSF